MNRDQLIEYYLAKTNYQQNAIKSLIEVIQKIHHGNGNETSIYFFSTGMEAPLHLIKDEKGLITIKDGNSIVYKSEKTTK